MTAEENPEFGETIKAGRHTVDLDAIIQAADKALKAALEEINAIRERGAQEDPRAEIPPPAEK